MHFENTECSYQHCSRLFLGDCGPYCVILASVILGPKSDLRLYALTSLQNSLKRHCKIVQKGAIQKGTLLKHTKAIQRFL